MAAERVENLIKDSFHKIGTILGFEIDPDAGKIFITGGNGPVGHRVASKLLNAGFPAVVCGAHHPEEMKNDKDKEGAEIVHFVWEDPNTYAGALTGIKTVR
jgi:nucleoside-diphosphate-sugar epimerase